MLIFISDTSRQVHITSTKTISALHVYAI